VDIALVALHIERHAKIDLELRLLAAGKKTDDQSYKLAHQAD